jgi:DNA-binding transcriptional MocR family regulator
MIRSTVPIQLARAERSEGDPLHGQIARQLESAIARGALRAGDLLPYVRQWAKRLSVSPTTITTAYGSLVALGLVQAVPRSGYRVTGALPAHICAGGSEAEGVGSGSTPLLSMDAIVPHLAVHPVAAFGALVREVSLTDPAAGGYEDPMGYVGLRAEALRLARGKGIAALGGEAQLLITAGTQQALHMVARLLRPGDRVIVEEPAYPGALRAFERAGAELLPVPMTPAGVDLEAVGNHARAGRVRLMYACPNYQNPTGYSYSREVSSGLVALAEHHGFRIFEDDYLGDLRYDCGSARCTPPPMAATGSSRVIYACTLSKCLLPGLRVAYVVADADLIDRLGREKALVDVCGSSYMQRALARFLASGAYELHLAKVRPHYATVRRAFGEEAARVVTTAGQALRLPLSAPLPEGGLCAFWGLPGGLDAARLADECRAAGLTISPGEAYYTVPGKGHSMFRVAFSSLGLADVGAFGDRLLTALERLDGYFNATVL